MKNSTIWTILDEDSYTSEEIEWIEKYIGGDSYDGTFYYDYPSTSSTPQKYFMPSDQRAKILAMHRDAKANAGIYVGIILSFYFIFLFLLFRRNGIKLKWRREANNATVEQGLFCCKRTNHAQNDRENGKNLTRFLCCCCFKKEKETAEVYQLNEPVQQGREKIEAEKEKEDEEYKTVQIFTVENEFKKFELDKRRKIKLSLLEKINEDSKENSAGEDDEED